MDPAAVNTFSVWDYVIFALLLAVSAAIGLYYGCTGGKQNTVDEFLMANRSMSVAPVALSLLASFMSAITLLGTPSEVYLYGTQYWMIWLGYVIMIPCAAYIFIPIFFGLTLTSVFEYLEMRFSRGIRLSCCFAYIIQMTLYLAIVLYAPSLALSAVTGLNVWISVFSVGIVCTFYTTLGGMKAVMWTDCFQIVIMFIGLIAVLVQGSIDAGGFGNIWRDMQEGERIEFFDFDPNPLKRHSIWTLTFGGAFTWLAIYGVNQAQVQRALAVPRMWDAQLALWINLPGLTALLTVCGLAGMVVYSQYKDCDPLSTKRIQAADQLLPLYVMDRLGHLQGLPGLFTASLFSGALSTISSGLNSLSAVTLQDIVLPLCFPNLSESRKTLTSKLLALVYGVICLCLTFLAANLGGVLQAALGLFGMIGGPQLGVFMLGILYPWSNTYGAYAGFYSGLAVTLWLGIGAQYYKPSFPKAPISIEGCPVDNITDVTVTMMTSIQNLTTAAPAIDGRLKPGYISFYEISYMYYSCIAIGVVTVVGLVVSFITGPNKPKDVDRRLICPLFDYFCCCLPWSWRNSLQCGIDHTDKYAKKKKVPTATLR